MAIARNVGLTDNQIAAAATVPRDGAALSAGLSGRDRTLMTAVDELVLGHQLSDDTWNALRGLLDSRAVFELSMLAGSYAMLAGALNTFGVPLEPAWATATQDISGPGRL